MFVFYIQHKKDESSKTDYKYYPVEKTGKFHNLYVPEGEINDCKRYEGVDQESEGQIYQ